MALIAMGSVACGPQSTATPTLPGSIVVTTATSGFMKDTSYELLVNGESKGTIGANDQMTIDALDPATYDVELGDLADNCTVEGDSIELGSGQTADASLNIVCTYGAPTSYTLRFSRERPDLDADTIMVCPFGICSTQDQWDLYVHDNTSADPQSVIRQNQNTGVEIAHLPGVTLDSLTEADVEGATFTADLVSDPFDADRVILIRTDMGAVYALGNPVEDLTAQTLTFDAVLLED